MCKISLLDKVSFILVILGAINWGLIGLFNLNLVAILVNNSIVLQRLIYIIIFASAINLILVSIKCSSFNIKR